MSSAKYRQFCLGLNVLTQIFTAHVSIFHDDTLNSLRPSDAYMRR